MDWSYLPSPRRVQGQLKYGAGDENGHRPATLSRCLSWCVREEHLAPVVQTVGARPGVCDSAKEKSLLVQTVPEEGKVNHVCVENRRFSFVIFSALKVLQQPGGRVKVLQWFKQHPVSQHIKVSVQTLQRRLLPCLHCLLPKYFVIHCWTNLNETCRN